MGLRSLVRWVRAAGFAVTCVGLAAAGHLAAGGKVQSFALVAGFAIIFVPALALTRREHGLGTILPAVAVCQVVLHALLGQMSPGHAAPVMEAMPASHGGPPPGLGMLLAHAVAVLITSWWLERGEVRLCDLVRRVASWALRVLVWVRPAAVHGPAPAAPVVWVRRPLPAAVLRHVMVRRGPPAGALTL